MTALPLPQHPILECVTEMERTLDEVAGAQSLYLSTSDKGAAMQRLAAIEARVAALRLGVMATADDVAEGEGARDVAAWFSHHTLSEPDVARADQRLARSLERDRPQVAAALAAGRCSVAQARVIAHALEELPARLGRDVIVAAETTLVEHAAYFRPSQLRRLGRHLLEVVAPEIADAEEGRRLAAEERHAREKTRLGLRPLGDGTTRLSGRLPDAAASRLKTYLEAFTSPRQVATSAPRSSDDRIPYPRRLGEAFCALLERLDPARLPQHGGDATLVMVTITFDQLRSEVAAAGLLDGEAETSLSAGELRRLACGAGILPVVLGGRSEILDLGRTRRLFSPAQRKALRLRDRRCRAEGCTVAATWTEAHHPESWANGGRTDLGNAVSLCSHHHRAHDTRYAIALLPDGDVRFHRRT